MKQGERLTFRPWLVELITELPEKTLLLLEAADGSLTATPYTFYVMPDAKSRTRLVMNSDTAAFHVKNHFDFNAWIKVAQPAPQEAIAQASAALEESAVAKDG